MAETIEDFSSEGGEDKYFSFDDEYISNFSDVKQEEVSYRYENPTIVFWDLVTYTIPREAILQPVGENIKLALEQIGIHGVVYTMAYGENLNHLKDELDKAGIEYRPAGYREMVLDVIAFATSCRGDLMIIPKPDPDSEFYRVLKCLHARYHDLFLVKPPDDEDCTQDGLCLDSVQSILDCTQGIDGRKPIIRAMRIDYTLDDDVLEDFSKHITFVEGAKAGVFWDLEDFPFPCGWSPDMIYEKIESAFRDDDVEGKISVWVYVDDKDGPWGGDYLKNKTWNSSIYFLPGGYNKSARSDRMLHDILLFTKDSPMDYPVPTYVIVVSGKVKGDEEFSSRLKCLHLRNYSVSLVTPSANTVPATGSEWWPKSDFGEEYSFA